MLDPPPQLRRTGRARTTHRDLPGPLHDARAACRTCRRKHERHRLGGSPRPVHAGERRNYFPRFFDINEIPHAQIPPRDLLAIVQRRPRHRRPRQHHRLQFRHRRQHARAPHLDRDRAQPRLRPLRREFVGDRPPRRTFPAPQFALRRHLVELHHRPVRRKRETRPRPLHRLHRPPRRVRPARRPQVAHPGQAPRADFFVQSPLRRRPGPRRLARTDPIKHHRESAPPDLRRIKLPQRPRRQRPRIRKPRLPRRLALRVHALKFRERHIHLSPHLDHRREPSSPLAARRPPQNPRQPRDRPHVRRHLVALDPVPARDRPHEPSLLERDTHRQPVELRLDHKRDVALSQRLLRPRGKGPPFRLRVSLLQTQHPLAMPIGLEQPAPVVAHLGHRRRLARRVWKSRLPRPQLPLQRIVVPIADLRRRLPMIERVVPRDLRSQRGNLLARHRRSRRRRHCLGRGSRCHETEGAPHHAEKTNASRRNLGDKSVHGGETTIRRARRRNR